MKTEQKLSKNPIPTTKQSAAHGPAIVPANAAKRLAVLETVIAKRMRSYIAVGRALAEIREKKLYGACGFESFPEYLERRYGWKKSYGHQLIKSSELCTSLSTIVDKEDLPAHESQVRPLLRLQTNDARKVWAKVIKTSKKEPITAERVAEVAVSMFPPGRKSKSAKRRVGVVKSVQVNDLSRTSRLCCSV